MGGSTSTEANLVEHFSRLMVSGLNLVFVTSKVRFTIWVSGFATFRMSDLAVILLPRG